VSDDLGKMWVKGSDLVPSEIHP